MCLKSLLGKKTGTELLGSSGLSNLPSMTKPKVNFDIFKDVGKISKGGAPTMPKIDLLKPVKLKPIKIKPIKIKPFKGFKF